jgi:hypothetical protein
MMHGNGWVVKRHPDAAPSVIVTKEEAIMIACSVASREGGCEVLMYHNGQPVKLETPRARKLGYDRRIECGVMNRIDSAAVTINTTAVLKILSVSDKQLHACIEEAC